MIRYLINYIHPCIKTLTPNGTGSAHMQRCLNLLTYIHDHSLKEYKAKYTSGESSISFSLTALAEPFALVTED